MLTFVLKNQFFGNLTLTHDPIGWDSFKYSFKRSKDYSGITKNFVIDELGFIKEGYDYIKSIFKAQDIQAEIKIEVWKEVNFKKELFFTGVLEFLTYSDDGKVIFLPVGQSGFTMRFLNNDEIPVDVSKNSSLQGSNLTILPNNLIEVPLHSKTIQKRFIAEQESDYTISQPYKSEKFDEFEFAYVGLETTKSNELADVFNFGVGFFGNEPFEFFDVKESGSYVFDILLPVQILVKGREHIVSFKMYLTYKLNEEPEEDLLVYDMPVLAKNTDYDADYDGQTGIFDYITKFTGNFAAGDKVRLYFKLKLLPLYDTRYYFIAHKTSKGRDAKLIVTGDTTYPETTCFGQLPFETFTRVCESITDQSGIFESTLFGRTDSYPVAYDEDGDASLYLCTGGKQIRKLPIEEHPLFFTFKDLFNSFDAKHNIGVGVENRDGKEVVVIEKKEYFYKDTMIADLGTVANITTSLALEYYNNSVKIGYEKYENEVVNGIDEIASEAQYITPISQVKETYERLSPYRSDGYGIETARRLSDKPTTDSAYDKDNFLICLQRDEESYKTEQDSSFDYIENVISPSTIYNGRDTPARMVRRHGNMITPGLFKASGSLKYIKGEANNQMASKLSTESIQVRENADIELSELEKPLFIPRHHEFEHPAKTPLLRAIENNPYGYLKYKDQNNIEHKAYIEDLEFDINSNKAQFKLLVKYE